MVLNIETKRALMIYFRFLGGVPPLESMLGLPAYEETDRKPRASQSNTATLPAVLAYVDE